MRCVILSPVQGSKLFIFFCVSRLILFSFFLLFQSWFISSSFFLLPQTSPYHLGFDCDGYQGYLAAPKCRYCEAAIMGYNQSRDQVFPSSFLGSVALFEWLVFPLFLQRVCNQKECQETWSHACRFVHPVRCRRVFTARKCDCFPFLCSSAVTIASACSTNPSTLSVFTFVFFSSQDVFPDVFFFFAFVTLQHDVGCGM